MGMSRFILLAALLSVVCNASGGYPPPLANGLVLWLDAADASKMTVDAQNHLLRWHDKSGEANDVAVDDAASASLPLRVEHAMNGHAVVRFSGSSAFLGKTIRAAKGPVILLIVSRRLTEQSGGETWQRLFSSRPIIADNDNVPPNFASCRRRHHERPAVRHPARTSVFQLSCRTLWLANGVYDRCNSDGMHHRDSGGKNSNTRNRA